MENDLETVFTDLLTLNKDKLFRICYSYSSNIDDTKDLYQEVLLNIWKSLPSFKGDSRVTTWALRIAMNVCLRARQLSIKKETHFVRLESLKYENIPEASTSNKNSEIERLYACIKQLPVTDKSIILLYLEETAYKDIASIIGISENHVAVKIKRIKEKLLTCLK